MHYVDEKKGKFTVWKIGMKRRMGYLSLGMVIGCAAVLCGMAPARSKTPSLKLLFQEISFNLPTDYFFVVEFFPATGRSRFLKRVSTAEVFDVLEKRQSVPWSSSNGHSGVRYVRKDFEEKEYDFYDCVLLNKQTHEIYKNLGIEQATPLFLKKESFWKELDSLKPNMERARSFIRLSEDGFLLFFSYGTYVELVQVADGKQMILRRVNGIVSESGRVNENWGWFCQRPNPKSAGKLMFIRLDTGKLVKGVQSGGQCILVTILADDEANALIR